MPGTVLVMRKRSRPLLPPRRRPSRTARRTRRKRRRKRANARTPRAAASKGVNPAVSCGHARAWTRDAGMRASAEAQRLVPGRESFSDVPAWAATEGITRRGTATRASKAPSSAPTVKPCNVAGKVAARLAPSSYPISPYDVVPPLYKSVELCLVLVPGLLILKKLHYYINDAHQYVCDCMRITVVRFQLEYSLSRLEPISRTVRMPKRTVFWATCEGAPTPSPPPPRTKIQK